MKNSKPNLNQKQINFLNSQRKENESLNKCALRIAGEIHRKITSRKKSNLIKKRSFIWGEIHPAAR